MIIILFSSTVIPEAAADFQNPVSIRTAGDLYAVRNNPDGNYSIENDIDISVYDNWIPIGTKESPFTGKINGNNHTIKGLHITETGVGRYAGLLGYAQKAEITGIRIEGSINIISDYITAGGICAEITDGKIDRCISSVNIEAESSDSWQSFIAGGIVGFAISSEINECVFSGVSSLKIKDETNAFYENCYSGGICGHLSGNMTDCRNTGNLTVQVVNQTAFAGGLTGYFTDGIMKTSYNYGNLSVSGLSDEALYEKHPLVGLYEVFDLEDEEDGIISHLIDCYYLNITGSDFYGISLNKEEFGIKESFSGFDFEKIWEMPEGAAAPLLIFESESAGPENDELNNAKQSAGQEIDKAVPDDASDAVKKIAADAKEKIDEATSIEAVNAEKTNAINSIKDKIAEEKETEAEKEKAEAEKKINVNSASGTITSIKYNQPAKIIASATGLPKGYKLAIYEGNSLKVSVKANDMGEAKIEFETGEITTDRVFTVKVLDASGKEVDGKSKTITIDIDDGFFAKIISFFLKLFGALKAVELNAQSK